MGRSEGGYFVGLLMILHFGNAFCSSATPTGVTLVPSNQSDSSRFNLTTVQAFSICFPTFKLSGAACPRPLECLVRPSFPQLRGAERFPLLPVATTVRCLRILPGHVGSVPSPPCGIQRM